MFNYIGSFSFDLAVTPCFCTVLVLDVLYELLSGHSEQVKFVISLFYKGFLCCMHRL